MTKQQRIDNETLRRAQEGNFSDYVNRELSGAASRLGVTAPVESDFTPNWRTGSSGDGMEQQQQAINLINQLDATPSWPEILARKEQLVGIPAVTTDFDESRNMYQYMINEMLHNNRGAKLLDVSQIPEGWRRTGGTTFTDPNNPDLLRDLKGLASFENPGVVNLREYDNKGILDIEEFQKGWAQGDPDTGEGLGIKDYGNLFKSILAPAPFKLYEMARSAAEKVKDSDPLRLVGDVGIGALEQAAKPIDYLTQQIENLSKMFRGVK